MATKNNLGPFDCYANAESDEPMFILLARDRHAPALVKEWARRREAEGEDLAKVEEARKVAVSMRQWREEHRPGSASRGLTVEFEERVEEATECIRGAFGEDGFEALEYLVKFSEQANLPLEVVARRVVLEWKAEGDDRNPEVRAAREALLDEVLAPHEWDPR